MNAKDLKGTRVTIQVNEAPCRCIYPGSEILTETVTGTIRGFKQIPAGPIGFLETDAGSLVCFDAGADIASGKIEIQLIEN